MAFNISDIGKLSSNLNQYIVRPINAFGLGGFVFDVEGDATVNLNTEITDHFIEDTTTVQDHIVVKPKKVTLKNYVGELAHTINNENNTSIQKTVRKLTTVSQYLPELTEMTQQLLNLREDNFLSNMFNNPLTSKTINRVTDYWAFVKNSIPDQSKQAQAYMYFKALMEGKTLISVQTPFEFMPRMAIESIVARQGEDSKYISDFTITLKQIRTAELLTAPKNTYSVVQDVVSQADQFQGRLFDQMRSVTNQGSVQGIPIPRKDPPPLPPVFKDLF